MVNPGQADGRVLFFLQRQRRDSTRGAHLAAGVAGIAAIAQARHQARRQQVLHPAFKKARLQALRGADADARAATDAQRGEIGQRRAWRPVHRRWLALGNRLDASQRNARHRGPHRRQHLAPCGVVVVPIRDLPVRHLPTEADAFARAVRQAVETDDALRRIAAVVVAGVDRVGGALVGTAGALGADVAHLAPDQRKL